MGRSGSEGHVKGGQEPYLHPVTGCQGVVCKWISLEIATQLFEEWGRRKSGHVGRSRVGGSWLLELEPGAGAWARSALFIVSLLMLFDFLIMCTYYFGKSKTFLKIRKRQGGKQSLCGLYGSSDPPV